MTRSALVALSVLPSVFSEMAGAFIAVFASARRLGAPERS